MEVNKKMELLEDMLALSLIVLMDEEFGKEINGSDIKKLSTVQDILDLMD